MKKYGKMIEFPKTGREEDLRIQQLYQMKISDMLR